VKSRILSHRGAEPRDNPNLRAKEKPPQREAGGDFRSQLNLKKSRLRPDLTLLQGGVDPGKGSVNRSAKSIDRGDDRKRDAGGNEAVLDSGSGGLIVQKTGKEIFHK
jgi:hypothetical protein